MFVCVCVCACVRMCVSVIIYIYIYIHKLFNTVMYTYFHSVVNLLNLLN